MEDSIKIKRGCLYVVDFEPRIHTKPGKQRPAVVVQSDMINEAGYASTLVIPTTSKVVEDAGFLRLRLSRGMCGLEKDSDLLLGQLIAVANISFKKDLGMLPAEVLKTLNQRLVQLLSLEKCIHQSSDILLG